MNVRFILRKNKGLPSVGNGRPLRQETGIFNILKTAETRTGLFAAMHGAEFRNADNK